MKSRHRLTQKMELFYRNIPPKKQQVAKNKKMRLQVELEFEQNEIKRLAKNTTWKCLVHTCLVQKVLLQNRKLKSLKSFCSKVKNHTRPHPPADSIQKGDT